MVRLAPKKSETLPCLKVEFLSNVAALCMAKGQERKFTSLVSRMSGINGLNDVINTYKSTKSKPKARRKKKNEWIIDIVREESKTKHKKKNAKTADAFKRQNKSKGKAAKTGRKDNVTNSDTKKQKCVFCMPASGHKNMPRCPLCNVFDDVDDKELFAKHLSDYHNVDLSRYSKNTKGGENCKGKKRASQENEGGQIQVDQKARPSTFHGSGNFQVPCEQSPGCAEPKAVLIRSTDIPTDGNCFFYSIIKILKLSLTPSEIRRLLLVSPFVDSCIDPAGVRTILSSDRKYPEMDCIHIFSKVFDKNLCIHNHYVDSNTNEEVRQYVHFRVNTSQSFLHLHLQNAHYTPFIEISFY